MLGELALPSTGSWLPSRLDAEQSASRAHFFQLEIRKKAGHFKSKAGKRDVAKKAVLLTPMKLTKPNVDCYRISLELSGHE